LPFGQRFMKLAQPVKPGTRRAMRSDTHVRGDERMGIKERTNDARREAGRAARRARAATVGEPRGPRWMGAVLLAGLAGIGGAIVAFLADPSRGRSRRARLMDQGGAVIRRTGRRAERAVRAAGATASGAMEAVKHAGAPSGTGAVDDVTLAARAETELFRDPSVPKGSININAERGTLVLRGEVPSADLRERLVSEAERIDGVWSVHNLLRVEGEEVGAPGRS
jgi:osmotically-inducible protein OsmY